MRRETAPRATAERLVLLLPKGGTTPAAATQVKSAPEPRWLLILLVYCAVALGISLTNMMAHPSAPPVAAQAGSVDKPAANPAHHP